MIDVRNINIEDMFSVKFLYITFTVSAMIEPQETYKFDIYRSVNQSELFTIVANDVKNFRYKDEDVKLSSLSLHYYYKVKITNRQTGEVHWSDVVRYTQAPADKWSMAISRILEKYVKDTISNPKVYLLQKRKTGQRCPCYNPNRDASLDDDCKLCYGTGYVGGYYSPEEIYVTMADSDSYTNEYIPRRDNDKQLTSRLWTLNFPKIEVGDIIVDNDVRSIVTDLTVTTKTKYILRQIATVERLPKTNVAHSIPIIKE